MAVDKPTIDNKNDGVCVLALGLSEFPPMQCFLFNALCDKKSSTKIKYNRSCYYVVIT